MKNLKVAFKLGLGFAAVLTLTAILALVSIATLNNLVGFSDDLDFANQIQQDVQHLEVLTFQLQQEMNVLNTSGQQGSQNHLDAIRQQFHTLNNNLPKFSQVVVSSADKALVNELTQGVTSFEQAFNQLLQAQTTIQTLVQESFTLDAAATRLINDLNNRLNGSSDQPILHVSPARALAGRSVAELSHYWNNLKFERRGVQLMGTNNLAAAETAYSNLDSRVNQLENSLSGIELNTLREIDTQLEAYIDNLRNMAKNSELEQQAAATQSQVYQRAVEILEALVDTGHTIMASNSHKATVTLISVTLLAIALGILISWGIMRSITHPLQRAVSIAQAIGNNDLSGKGVEARKDEFGQLLNAMDKSRADLRQALHEVDGFTKQLAAAAEELSAVTAQTSAGVNSQREETEQVATAMNEMTATVQEVAKNAEQTAVVIDTANTRAIQGDQVLQEALDANNRLTTQVQQTSEAMHNLNEDSNNISTVLTVINGIAEQTNLLALNAAIEAARAGDAGRGFAVVADEVRGLAQRTQESTSQIEELIAKLQTGSGKAVHMMASSRSLADATLELVNKASHELKAIVSVVAEVQAMGAQIATAAEEQSLVAEEINRSVTNVNAIADQSASATEETSAASAELARLGQELQSLVGRFKLA